MKTKNPVICFTHEGAATVEQVLVVHVNIGQLAPIKAARHVEAIKEGMLPLLQKLPKTTGVVFLPSHTDTRIELVPYLGEFEGSTLLND